MRFECPSCHQTFYIDSTKNIPCPACSATMVNKDAGEAPPPPPTPEFQLPEGAQLEGFFGDTSAAGANASDTVFGLASAPMASPQEAAAVQAGAPTPLYSQAVQPGALPSMQATMAYQGSPAGSDRYASSQRGQRGNTYLYVIPSGLAMAVLITLFLIYFIVGGDESKDEKTKAGEGTVAVVAAVPEDDSTKNPVEQTPEDPEAPDDDPVGADAVVDETQADGGDDANAVAEVKTGPEGETPVAAVVGKIDGTNEDMEALRDELKQMQELAGARKEAAELLADATSALDVTHDAAIALSKLDEAIALDGTNVAARRLRGRALVALGRIDEALKAFDGADEESRKAGKEGDVESLVAAGELCSQMLHDRKKAIGYFGRALAMQTDSPYARYAAARHLHLRGDVAGAAKGAASLRKSDPSFALAPSLLGEIVQQKASVAAASERGKLIAEADKHFDDAIRLDPNLGYACLRRGRLLLEGANVDAGFGLSGFSAAVASERFLKRAATVLPNWGEIHMALADLYVKSTSLRNPEKAVEHSERAVALTDNGSARALALHAEALYAGGKKEAAIETVSKAIELEPGRDDLVEALERYESEAEAETREVTVDPNATE